MLRKKGWFADRRGITYHIERPQTRLDGKSQFVDLGCLTGAFMTQPFAPSTSTR